MLQQDLKVFYKDILSNKKNIDVQPESINFATFSLKDVEEFLVQLGFMPSKEEQRQMEVAAMTGQMPAPEAQMVEETEAVVQEGDY